MSAGNFLEIKQFSEITKLKNFQEECSKKFPGCCNFNNDDLKYFSNAGTILILGFEELTAPFTKMYLNFKIKHRCFKYRNLFFPHGFL